MWIERATSSFPVPLSPIRSTVLSVRATLVTSRKMRCILGLAPTMSRYTVSAGAAGGNSERRGGAGGGRGRLGMGTLVDLWRWVGFVMCFKLGNNLLDAASLGPSIC